MRPEPARGLGDPRPAVAWPRPARPARQPPGRRERGASAGEARRSGEVFLSAPSGIRTHVPEDKESGRVILAFGATRPRARYSTAPAYRTAPAPCRRGGRTDGES